MAQVKFEYDLNDERNEALTVFKASRLACAIYDLSMYLRNEYKYNDEIEDCCREAIDRARKALSDIVEDNEIGDVTEL